jgi:hypothetical protein
MDCITARERSVELLYDEADPETRRLLDEHHAQCAACREDFAGLLAVRRTLRTWTLPASLERPVRLSLPRPSRWPLLAAAAALVLASGLALRLAGARVELRGGPVLVSLGPGSASDLEARLAAQEVRHREELRALEARFERSRPQGAAAAASDGEAVLAEVRRLLAAESTRQRGDLQAGLVQIEERAEARRRYDLARISAGLSYLDGRAGQQVARTTELMNYMLQASQEK